MRQRKRKGNRSLIELRDLVLAMPKHVMERAAPAIAEVLRAETERTIAAATTPSGAPWELRIKDEGKPLRNAARALEVSVAGTSIALAIRGIEGRHHRGQVRGGTKRQIIPVRKLPEQLTAKVRAVLDDAFREVTSG